MMRRLSRCSSALAFGVVLFLLAHSGTPAPDVGLVALDVKEVAKGYSSNALKARSVINDKGELIGRIDDFIFSRDNAQIFAALAVGDYVGLGGHVVAVPSHSLKLDDSSGLITLPGASRAALQKLPVFLYSH